MGLFIAKNGQKMAKNGRFWPFYLVFSYSTETTSLLMLQNVSYHHAEQLLQTWSSHKCLMGLIIAKNGPKMAKNGCFWPFFLDSSSSTVTSSLLVLQKVRYYHTEQYLQTWRAHTCLKGDISRMLPALKQPFCTDLAWFHAFGMDGLTNQPTDQQTDGVTIESRAYE